MKVLVAVDLQNDFIDGALGVVKDPSFVQRVSRYLRAFSGEVIFLQDEHDSQYLQMQEGKKLPILHCQRGTWGQEIHQDIYHPPGARYFTKNQFVSLGLIDYLRNYEGLQEIYYLGLCSDICVVANLLVVKAFLPEVEHYFLSDLACGTSEEKHQATIEVLKSCQITILKDKD